MSDVIYTFNGKDITMNICIQIRAVVSVIQKQMKLSFEEAMLMFYSSNTYKDLQNTENVLWAESAEYIADRFFAEPMCCLVMRGRRRELLQHIYQQ